MQGQDPNNTTESRFWSKVDIKGPNDCWEWKAALGGQGYGNFYYSRIEHYAHRASWILTNGDIPKGMSILHKCDNPKCVNPNHLYIGTGADNWRDIKERLSFDLRKCNPEQIKQIKELRKTYCLRSIGLLFDITPQTIIEYCKEA